MNPALSAHEPLLVNTIGHTLGVVLFAVSLYFLLRGHAHRLSVAAAALALTWNLSSLLVLAWPDQGWLVSLSTSALSVLPAVLLHLSLGNRFATIVRLGYGLAGISVMLHALEEHADLGVTHSGALSLTTGGFAALTLLTALALVFSRAGDRAMGSRLAAAMALFLLAVSMAHFGHGEAHRPWSVELLVHHASVPLALLVLLQDYRFVLLDAFIRVVASLLLASAVLFAGVSWIAPGWRPSGGGFRQGLVLVAGCGALVLYAVLRARLQDLLTRVLFGRRDINQTIARLRQMALDNHDEAGFASAASAEIATFLRAPRIESDLPGSAEVLFPATVSSLPAAIREKWEQAGIEVVIPIRLGHGESITIALGHRAGGRRYLSEDLDAAGRLAHLVGEQIERFRAEEMRRLVAQAELRALESQIHPHFLFNALNTLYGVIPKQAAGARRTVLNLADILRYCLQPDRTLIPLDQELRIVEAYLEIEKLRLGDRLRTTIEIDEAAKNLLIPVLSLQPLVENAVKYGVSARPEGGEVRILARASGDHASIRVEDTGPGFHASNPDHGHGVGLDNVRRRLRLCYGPDVELTIQSGADGAAVEFRAPMTVTA